MAKLTKRQRQEAVSQGGASAAKYGVSLGTFGTAFSPIGGAIGAGVGVLAGGIGGYLKARRQLLDLQKMQKEQDKISRQAKDPAQAESRRQQGALSKQFDMTFPEMIGVEESTIGVMQPGTSSYDAYHARRYG